MYLLWVRLTSIFGAVVLAEEKGKNFTKHVWVNEDGNSVCLISILDRGQFV